MLDQLYPELRHLLRELLGVVDRGRLRGVCHLLWEDEPVEPLLRALGPVFGSCLPSGYDRSMRRRFERLVEELQQAPWPADHPLPVLRMGPVLPHAASISLSFSSRMVASYVPTISATFPLPLAGSYVYVLDRCPALHVDLHVYHPGLHVGRMSYVQVQSMLERAGKDYLPQQVWEGASLMHSAPYVWRCEVPNSGIVYYARSMDQVLAYDDNNVACLSKAFVPGNAINLVDAIDQQ